MAQKEEFNPTQFEHKIIRRDKVIIPWVVVARVVMDGEEVEWLQVGSFDRKNLQLDSGFMDLNPGLLRRGSYIERDQQGMLKKTRRIGAWIRLNDATAKIDG